MTFAITAACDGPSPPRGNTHGNMWSWTRWMALYGQTLTQRQIACHRTTSQMGEV